MQNVDLRILSLVIKSIRKHAKYRFVDTFVVFDSYRKQGFASLLLEHVEKIARDHHCHIAHLDTFDFQAKDFYLKHGYSIFGVLENAPKKHNRYYMKKDL